MTDFSGWDRAVLERLAAELTQEVLKLKCELQQAEKVARREASDVWLVGDIAEQQQKLADRFKAERDYFRHRWANALADLFALSDPDRSAEWRIARAEGVVSQAFRAFSGMPELADHG